MFWNDRGNGDVMRSTIQLGQGEGEKEGKENQTKKPPTKLKGSLRMERGRRGPTGSGYTFGGRRCTVCGSSGELTIPVSSLVPFRHDPPHSPVVLVCIPVFDSCSSEGVLGFFLFIYR